MHQLGFLLSFLCAIGDTSQIARPHRTAICEGSRLSHGFGEGHKPWQRACGGVIDWATKVFIRASSTHFAEPSDVKSGSACDALSITCSCSPPRGLSGVDMRFTGAVRSPMCTPQRPQGGLGEGQKPSQIPCGSVIRPPKSSSELPLYTLCGSKCRERGGAHDPS